MIYCFDLDETLCFSVEDDYLNSVPRKDSIDKVNKLFDEGHTIKIFTARGDKDNNGLRELTLQQLRNWGLRCHELIMGKPDFDILVDDKAINTKDWLNNIDGIKHVRREWGMELWLVNCDEYCSKLMWLPKGSRCKTHYHNKKKETFYCLQGQVKLILDNKEIMLTPFTKPQTILPSQEHSFWGTVSSILLEVSTQHSEWDTIFTENGG